MTRIRFKGSPRCLLGRELRRRAVSQLPTGAPLGSIVDIRAAGPGVNALFGLVFPHLDASAGRGGLRSPRLPWVAHLGMALLPEKFFKDFIIGSRPLVEFPWW